MNRQEGPYRENGKIIERLSIRSPIWDGRKVGIAAFRARRSDIVEVKILYKKKVSGKSLYGKLFRIPSPQVLTYPAKPANPDSNTLLHWVNISDMVEHDGE